MKGKVGTAQCVILALVVSAGGMLTQAKTTPVHTPVDVSYPPGESFQIEDADCVYITFRDDTLTFTLDSVQIELVTGTNGVLKARYNCPVDKAAESFWTAVNKMGDVMGYVLLRREEYERLKGE